MGYCNGFRKFIIFFVVILSSLYDVNGMMCAAEIRKEHGVQMTFSDLKTDSQVMEKQIAELASAAVVDMKAMRHLVDLLCFSASATQVSFAHNCFLKQWHISEVANYVDCIKRSGLLDDIRYHKVVGLATSVDVFWRKYNSGFYGPYQLSNDVRDDIEEL